jgi:hypothetical protein
MESVVQPEPSEFVGGYLEKKKEEEEEERMCFFVSFFL